MSAEKAHEGAEPAGRKTSKMFLALCGAVCVFGLVIAAYGGLLILSNEPEAYHNENPRHLAAGLSQATLGASLFAQHVGRNRFAWVTLAAAMIAIAWSMWLAFGR